MREIPIIFSGESIPLILAGRKTQTRRVVKWPVKGGSPRPIVSVECVETLDGAAFQFFDGYGYNMIRCPYGVSGDWLWVKETWGVRGYMSDPLPMAGLHPEGLRLQIEYKADEHSGATYYPDDENYDRIRKLVTCYEDECHWRSPRFMPRWASRISLERVGDRPPERVQEISFDDIMAEMGTDATATDLRNYMAYWNSLNAKRGHGWDKNDRVWPIGFKRVEA